MKKLIYTALLLGAMTLPVACDQHEIPLYSGDDAIFFDQQYGTGKFDSLRQAHQNYSFIPFGSLSTSDSTLLIKVETTGFVRDYDREFSFEVVADSTTMIEGVDYMIPSYKGVIAAGQNSTRISVVLMRSDHTFEGTQQLQLRLVPGEHFTLPFGEKGIGQLPLRAASSDVYTEYSTNTDPSIHNIFANALLQLPNGWNEGRFGKFSQKKYALILDISQRELGWGIGAFHPDNDLKMRLKRAFVVAGAVSKYLMEQFNSGRDNWVLDEDGTLMWVEGVTWAEGEDPSLFS